MTTSPEAAFFAALRPLFGGKLSKSQVDGVNVILAGIERYDLGEPAAAYILATTFHETAHTMQPVKETQFGATVPTDAVVKARLTKAWKAGKLPQVKKDYWSGGYFGRGYVQLTHAANYDKAAKALGIELGSNPDLALKPDVAVQILIKGMLEGWFTGKKLGDYITGTAFDFKNARRVVNGTESAEKIKGYAEAFLAAIRAGQAADKATRQPAPVPVPPKPQTPAGGAPIEPHEEPIAPPPESKPSGALVIIGMIVVAAILVAVVYFTGAN